MKRNIATIGLWLAFLLFAVNQSAGASLAGDINGDDVVNAVDVQLVINAALGLVIQGDADINGDDEINAVDVQLVINAALGINITPYEFRDLSGANLPWITY